ncbi:MAG: AIPR family protein [Alphaproteobacteria bacterium]|nr:AIPR family protein [Alphaproteobacteria bacterium]MCW5740760.1 AIPR family protein [Alphaproteobacteria bacterium]
MATLIEDTIIEERVKRISKANSLPPDMAFLTWVHSLLFDTDEGEIPKGELIEGSGEKQLDTINVDDDSQSESATVSFLQAKRTGGFSSNSLVLLSNGLSWVFEADEDKLAGLKNVALRNKITEIRDLLQEYGPSKLTVRVYMVTKGSAKDLSNEYQEERSRFIQKWSNRYFSAFTLHELGAIEIIERMQIADGAAPINERIKIEYDVNKGSVLQLVSEGVRSILCTVTGAELARLASLQPENSIFERNIRRHLGLRGKVNSEIYESCTNPDRSKFFWFMNNGITMTCDKFDPVLEPGKANIRVENAQIVNGCQTSMTLRRASEDKKLRADVKVQLKIYETNAPEFTDSIVLATNQQNSIKNRDLFSNRRSQLHLQQAIKDQFGLHYERKANEFKDQNIDRSKIINNEKAGQAYLAVCLRQPTVARAQKYKVFDDDWYTSIFEKIDPGHFVLSDAIVKYCQQQTDAELMVGTESSRKYNLGLYGVFHLSSVFGRHLLGSGKWPTSGSADYRSALKTVMRREKGAAKIFDQSVKTMLSIMAKAKLSKGEWNNYFKSSRSYRDINVHFDHESTPRRRKS